MTSDPQIEFDCFVRSAYNACIRAEAETLNISHAYEMRVKLAVNLNLPSRQWGPLKRQAKLSVSLLFSSSLFSFIRYLFVLGFLNGST
jgi:hypothetical protein